MSSFSVLLTKLGFVTDHSMTDVEPDVLHEKQRILGGLHRDVATGELNVVITGLRKTYKPVGGGK